MNIADLFTYEFIRNSLYASFLIGLIIPFIGVFVYIRKLGFIADAIGHINLSGVAFAIFAGSFLTVLQGYSFIIALLWTIFGAILIEFLREKFDNYKEISIVLVYALAVSFTIIFLQFSTSYNASLFNILFGNINSISQTEVYTILFLTVFVLILMIFFFKKFILLSLEENFVKMYSINFNFNRYLLIIIITIVIAMTIKLVGVLLVSSMLVIPLLGANNLANSLKKTIIINIAITEFSFIAGIIIGYYINVPANALIVLIAFVIYMLTLLMKRYSTK